MVNVAIATKNRGQGYIWGGLVFVHANFYGANFQQGQAVNPCNIKRLRLFSFNCSE